MEDELKAIIALNPVPADLMITYDDRHGLWGGTLLVLQGDGNLKRQTQVAGSAQAVGLTQQVSEQELRELVRLLVELEAWAQRVPNRLPVPDESRAYLTIQVNGQMSRMWEWFNDMAKNDRLMRIKVWMEEVGRSPK